MSIQTFLRNIPPDSYGSDEREDFRQKTLQKILSAVPEVISRFSSVRRAYLFGSVTQAEAFQDESDVDIAVEGAAAEDYFGLWNALEQILPGVTVALCELGPDSDFTRKIRKDGLLLYDVVYSHDQETTAGFTNPAGEITTEV